MQKIISLYQRNYDGDRLIRDEVVPGAEWVLDGEGVATRKWDGMCCAVIGGNFYKRYDAKHGKTPPEGFVPAQEPDPKTGHWPGWVPVGIGPEDRYHYEAFDREDFDGADGTYELIGPKIQGNPENEKKHRLVRHGSGVIPFTEVMRFGLNFEGIRALLDFYHYEGIVWHRSDGAMVKIKLKDFGIKRVISGTATEA